MTAMLAKIVIGLTVAVAVFAGVVALQPSDFRVVRSATMSAPPAAVFAWAGNRQAGEGRMALTESRPPELIRIRPDFVKPFAGTNTAEFTFGPEGDRTIVTWSMAGKRNFVAKAIGLFVSMDTMVGGEFEKRLENLESVTEAASRQWRATTKAEGDTRMRFTVPVKASNDSEAGVLPDEKILTEMGMHNDELVQAGVPLAAEGLHPRPNGARVKFSGVARAAGNS